MPYYKKNNSYNKPFPIGKAIYNQAKNIFKPISKMDFGQMYNQLRKSFNANYIPSRLAKPRNLDVSYSPLNLRSEKSIKQNYQTAPFKNVPARTIPPLDRKLMDIERPESEIKSENEPEKSEELIETEISDNKTQSAEVIEETKEDVSKEEVEIEEAIMAYEQEILMACEKEAKALENAETNTSELAELEIEETESQNYVDASVEECITEIDELEILIDKEIEKNANHENLIEIDQNDLEQELEIEKYGGLEDIVIHSSGPMHDLDDIEF